MTKEHRDITVDGAVTPDSTGDVVLKHGDVSPVPQFVWTYANTTVAQPSRDPATGTNNLDLFCLATDARSILTSLVKMDHMVSYLFLLRGTGRWEHSWPISLICSLMIL